MTQTPDTPSSTFSTDTTPPYGLPELSDSSSGGAARHVVSLLAGLILPPLAYVGFDWAFGRYWIDINRFVDGSDRALWPFAVIAGGALLLLVTAALGRLSPVGPFVAALLYGVAPTVAVVLARDEIFRAGNEVRGWSFTYDWALTNVPFYGIILFPAVAALLIGTAIAGAGRRN